MGRLQDVARFLLAAGGSASTDGKSTHLFHEVKNSLFMETWTGSELTDRVEVVTGVRSDTSAPLVNLHYKRIFVVDQSHVLKCFTETSKAEDEGDDEDEEEEEEDSRWEDEELDDLDIRVHDKSQLAVACGEFTIVVFYQNPDGTIGAIEDDGGLHGWKIAQLPNAEALPGTPMASFQAKDTVYFVYVAADQTFRYLEHSNNEWKDAPFSSAKIDGTSAKISLAEDEKAETDPKLLIFCLADKKLSTIKPGSTEAETWGTVEDGVYKPTSDQENNGSPQGSIPNPFHPGHLFIYSGPPPPPPPLATVPVPVPFSVAPFACYEDFGQLSLRDHAVEYQQPPPYEYPYGHFDGRYYDSHDEALLRQPAQRPGPRFVSQSAHDPSWQPPYQRPYRARDMYHRDHFQRDPYYQDGYPPDRYPQDYYQRDPYQRDPYERGPYQRDSNQPPQEFSRSRQQDPPQELPRQQHVPIQESLRQQQQQQQQQQQPPQELPRQQQPPQETQRQQQAPPQETQRQQEPVHRPPTVEDAEEEDDDDDSSTRPQAGTEPPRAPQPNHEETQQQQQRPQRQQRQQQQQQRRAVSPAFKSEDDDMEEALQRRHPQTQGRSSRQAFLDEPTHSSNNFGVLVKKHLSLIVKTDFGVLSMKSSVLVAFLLNIVAMTMSLIVPTWHMDMKIIIHPIDMVLAPGQTL
ncbi:hypothetical protein Trihar35433_2548 [Trichoderma harzianum]|nr:hypothetical protein Trihar35433_2548 [Trichoderma harzianum]